MSRNLEVCEGVESVWNYHLRESGSLRSLCGKPVMYTHIPIDRWNVKIPGYHIPVSYCRRCDELKDRNNE